MTSDDGTPNAIHRQNDTSTDGKLFQLSNGDEVRGGASRRRDAANQRAERRRNH
jgi:hypothetical protein